MSQIKNVGAGGIVEGLIAEREENGPFKLGRGLRPAHQPSRPATAACIESLAKRWRPRRARRSTAWTDPRSSSAPIASSRLAQVELKRQRETGQTSMFDLFGDEVDTPLPALELEAVATPQRELLGWERELLGAYVSAHPFREAAQGLAEYVTHQMPELTADLAGLEAIVAGMVTGVRRLTTRQGKAFAAVTIEDLSGAAELTVWPDSYEEHQKLLTHGNVLLTKVEVRERGDRLTLAVAALAAYDQDAGRPLAFDPSQFVPSRGRRRRRAADRNGANGANGNGAAPHLEAVPPMPDAVANGNGAAASAAPPGDARQAPSTNGARRNGGSNGDAATAGPAARRSRAALDPA